MRRGPAATTSSSVVQWKRDTSQNELPASSLRNQHVINDRQQIIRCGTPSMVFRWSRWVGFSPFLMRQAATTPFSGVPATAFAVNSGSPHHAPLRARFFARSSLTFWISIWLKGFTCRSEVLIDIMPHLFVIGGKRHRHGINAVFQHVQPRPA